MIDGVGLLGASVGRGTQRAGLAERVVGLDRSAEHCAGALSHGAVTEIAADWSAALAERAESAAENRPTLIVAAVPASAIADELSQAVEAIRRLGGAKKERRFLLTDVGSVKLGVQEEVFRRRASDPWPENVGYIGSHPIAGSEKSGPDAARADLFDGRWTVIIPPEQDAEQTTEQAAEQTKSAPEQDADLEILERFWAALGSRTFLLGAAEHDRIFARTSHLPHLLSAALASLSDDNSRRCVGSGLIDMTRLAAGNPEVWTDIFLMNADAVLRAVEQMEENLTVWKSALAAEDRTAISTLLQEAKKRRDALGS